MPIHDWSRVEAGIFHHFHHNWTTEISNALNAGILPTGYFALAEQVVSGPIPDVVTLQTRGHQQGPAIDGGGIAVVDMEPKASFMTSAVVDVYAQRANRIAIRHHLGKVIAVIEIVSPGNKSSRHALRAFVDKAVELLFEGVHLLVVDLLLPTPRDPQGIHKAIWDAIQNEPFELPAGKPLTIAAYLAGDVKKAYVEPVGVGDLLPSLPIFLDEGSYVRAPLEATYQMTWDKCPKVMKELVANA